MTTHMQAADQATASVVMLEERIEAVKWPVSGDELAQSIDCFHPYRHSYGNLWAAPGVTEFGGTFNGIEPSTVERVRVVNTIFTPRERHAERVIDYIKSGRIY